ncbi:MAG: hypothetical protein OXE74_06990, partial [Cyanobacteria bacterium MAG CAR2_bin_4]|nr:hypothetical protein [Cyanobacteria bacterium MAG CAR2_bin_4]
AQQEVGQQAEENMVDTMDDDDSRQPGQPVNDPVANAFMLMGTASQTQTATAVQANSVRA